MYRVKTIYSLGKDHIQLRLKTTYGFGVIWQLYMVSTMAVHGQIIWSMEDKIVKPGECLILRTLYQVSSKRGERCQANPQDEPGISPF